MNEEFRDALRVLAERVCEKKGRRFYSSHWFSRDPLDYKKSLNDTRTFYCHICDDKIDTGLVYRFTTFKEFQLAVEKHGIKHLKEYGLIAYL